LNGIQIMGILETRTLDFKNMIMLSVNEGIIPRATAGTSYIPFNLREAFGLPTIRHQDSIYAYYFYRLLQRAENVTFIYNSNSEGLRTGEMSRFLQQLKYLYATPPDFANLRYEITSQKNISSAIPRNENHTGKLEELYLGPEPKLLSPGAVNTWLRCRMKFYYRYICGLKEPEKISTEIDPAIFGGLLHSIMEGIYSPLRGEVLNKSKIDSIKRDEDLISGIIQSTVTEKFYKGIRREISGSDQIISNILNAYVHLILRLDRSFSPLTIIDLEKWISSNLEIDYEKRNVRLKAGGIIDRIDYADGTHRIIDYKTGSVAMEIESVEALFDSTDDKRNEAWFQILMYCELFSMENPGVKVRPSLYAVRNLSDSTFSDHLILKQGREEKKTIRDYSEIRSEFSSRLKSELEILFSKSEPFIMTDHRRKCESCPYRQLCQR
jgi:CRISPR/Cas system-associated exonuclease Cas4 (RecB family)